MNVSEQQRLAPSTRSDEAPSDRKGLEIQYYINVHCELSMVKDLIVTIPFILSGTDRKEGFFHFFILSLIMLYIYYIRIETKDDKTLPEMEPLVKILVEKGYSKSLAADALIKHVSSFPFIIFSSFLQLYFDFIYICPIIK